MSSHGANAYYPWYVQDFRASRKVQRMSYISRGLYRELLDEQFLEGSLPTDLQSLAEICGCPLKVMEKAWPEIQACFQESGGKLLNAKLELIRTERDQLRVKRAQSGRLGGIAKQTQASAKHKPYRREEKREKSKEEDCHLDQYATTWNENCGSLSKVQCLSIRSLLGFFGNDQSAGDVPRMAGQRRSGSRGLPLDIPKRNTIDLPQRKSVRVQSERSVPSQRVSFSGSPHLSVRPGLEGRELETRQKACGGCYQSSTPHPFGCAAERPNLTSLATASEAFLAPCSHLYALGRRCVNVPFWGEKDHCDVLRSTVTVTIPQAEELV